jgi:hypothetical protein
MALGDAEASRDETPHHPQFEAAYESGALVVVNAFATGGSVVELFVDEPVPTERLRMTLTINRELKLHCPSGSMALGRLDAYWSAKVRRKEPVHTFPVPPGYYRVKIHAGYSDERDDPELKHEIGEEDTKYYFRKLQSQIWGYLGFFVGFIPSLMVPGLNFFIVFTLSVLAGIGGCYFIGFLNRRNPRFRDIEKRIKDFEANRPYLIFELARLDEAAAAGMKGGEVVI